MKGTHPGYLNSAVRTCRNCDERTARSALFLGLCPICQRPLHWGILSGGIVVGVAIKFFEWLLAV